jgi:DNA-binding NarL/FixJ family response regulator
VLDGDRDPLGAGCRLERLESGSAQHVPRKFQILDVVVDDQDDERIQAAARLRETNPDIGVVLLSQYANPSYALALLEGGSAGRACLLKERSRISASFSPRSAPSPRAAR